MLEAKDQGHKRKCSPKKKKIFTKIFQAISTKKPFPKNFSSAPQNFNYSKNTAVLEPRTGQFSRTRGQGLDLRGQGQGLQNLSSRPRTSWRTPPLIFTLAIKFDCLFFTFFQSFHLFVSFIFDKLAPP